MLKKYIIFFLVVFVTSPLYSQCEDLGTINSQIQIDSLLGCEMFQGNLVLSGSGITDLSSLSSLSVVTGSFALLNTSVTELMDEMTEKKIRHILIMENKKLLGIVSIGDVVNHLIKKIKEENKNLRDYINSY